MSILSVHILVTYDVNDSSGNVATQIKRFVNIVDTTRPVLSLNGPKFSKCSCVEHIREQGATCTDNYDTNCSVSHF